MRRVNLVLLIVVSLSLIGFASLSYAGQAQGDVTKGLDEVVNEFDVQDATVQDAIGALLKDTGINYIVDPTVRGKIALTLRGVTRRKLLDVICEQANAEWTLEDNIVRIKPKAAQPTTQPGAPGRIGMPQGMAPVAPETQMEGQVRRRRTEPTIGIQTAEEPETEEEEYVWARIPLRFADALMVAQLFGGQVITPTGGLLASGGGGLGGYGGFGGLGGFGGGFGGLGGYGGFG
ncbi:MAG TPA: hypothetical protein EYP10_10985, partial [Armatimonadetes bacterium]|nr:hypothetical protein [Armatimonadota bacterium]